MHSYLSAFNEGQKEAITTEDPRVLVLAGAGSGKTKTLLQRIQYLIDKKGVRPSEILGITFTKAAANEMIDRLIISADSSGQYEKIMSDVRQPRYELDKTRRSFKLKHKWISGLTIKTFHSLCYTILRQYGANEFDNKFRILLDSKTDNDEEFINATAPELAIDVMQKILIKRSKSNEFLLDFKRYILDYYVDKRHMKEGPYKELNTYTKDFTALDGTKVRSKSEQYIADWLYRHSIKYKYEATLTVENFSFRPDFFIPSANLCIEHVSDKSYPMAGKLKEYKRGGLHCVQTHDRITKDTSLFNHELDRIFAGMLPKDYHSTIVLNFSEELKGYLGYVKDCLTQVLRVMDMIKTEGLSVEEIQLNSSRDQHERVRSFYELALPLIEDFRKYCVNKSYLDFNDLISTTISLCKNNPDILQMLQSTFKYILVDEFQDVNNLQVDLLNLTLTPESRLFCVGDDWQSIYGFRGSNVSYIIEFQKHFPGSRLIKLDTNYRSTTNIVEASNEVIKYNKYKVEKEISAFKKSATKISVFAGSSIEENVRFTAEEASRLYEQGFGVDDILFLYRRTKMLEPYREEFNARGMKLKGKTIHGAKGLEARIVFIIGLTDGSGGFPDVWLMDRIFQTIKKSDGNLLLEEERRLFYVALTRAKEKVYLLTEKGSESRFLDEIPVELIEKQTSEFKPVVEEVESCKKCNSKLDQSFSFCPFCGMKIMKD
jgi:superfamily I DNA/RNA helicase